MSEFSFDEQYDCPHPCHDQQERSCYLYRTNSWRVTSKHGNLLGCGWLRRVDFRGTDGPGDLKQGEEVLAHSFLPPLTSCSWSRLTLSCTCIRRQISGRAHQSHLHLCPPSRRFGPISRSLTVAGQARRRIR